MHELVPIVLFISMFGALFGIFYIRSRENMAMLEKGFNPRNHPVKIFLKPFFGLKIGLLLMGAGLGLLIAFFVNNSLDHKSLTPDGAIYYRDFTEIYIAFVAIGGGLGLLISYILEKKWIDKHKDDIPAK